MCRRRNAHDCLVSIDTRWWSFARPRQLQGAAACGGSESSAVASCEFCASSRFRHQYQHTKHRTAITLSFGRFAAQGTCITPTAIQRITFSQRREEMQQRAFRGTPRVQPPAAAFRLHRGTGAEHLDIATVAGVQERRTVDPTGHRETIVHAAAETFGVEPDGGVEVRRPDRDVVEAEGAAWAAHDLSALTAAAGVVAGRLDRRQPTAKGSRTGTRERHERPHIPGQAGQPVRAGGRGANPGVCPKAARQTDGPPAMRATAISIGRIIAASRCRTVSSHSQARCLLPRRLTCRLRDVSLDLGICHHRTNARRRCWPPSRAGRPHAGALPAAAAGIAPVSTRRPLTRRHHPPMSKSPPAGRSDRAVPPTATGRRMKRGRSSATPRSRR